MLAGELPHLRLGHISEREKRPAELLLRQTEQEICLVLGMIRGGTTCGTLQQPPATLIVEFHSRVMPRCYSIRANLLGNSEQLIELQMIVAEAAWNGGSSG